MPRRSNFFQDVVELIHRHLAGDAVVEGSALLTDLVSGDKREVDVVITSEVAGHEVRVKVEARSGRRKADVPWVEQQLAKHRTLPSGVLVLVSEPGFAKTAREKAEREGAIPVAPEDIGDGHGLTLVDGIEKLWPKRVSFTLLDSQIDVVSPRDGEIVGDQAEPVYSAEGQPLLPVNQLVMSLVEAALDHHFLDLATEVAGTAERRLTLRIDPCEPLMNGKPTPIFARIRFTDNGEEALGQVKAIELEVVALVETFDPIELTQKRVAGVVAGYGATASGNDRGVLVLTEDGRGGNGVTLRLRTDGHQKPLDFELDRVEVREGRVPDERDRSEAT
jgi:hypothetical protein